MSSAKETPTWFKPGYPPLGYDDVGNAAIEGQSYEYPSVVRRNADPPISNQGFGNLSFMLLDNPRSFRGKPIYGFVKIRGNHFDKESAIHDAHRIIKEVDSKYQVRTAPVGVWVPITENTSVVEEMIDVRESDEEHHIRDEAVRQREAEAKKIARELNDGDEKSKNSKDVYEQPDSLDFYTMKRVTENKLFEAVEVQRRKIKELEERLMETYILCKKLDVEHPSYKEQWVDNYNAERAKASIPAFVPIPVQVDAYDNLTLQQLVDDYPELNEKVDKNLELYRTNKDTEKQ